MLTSWREQELVGNMAGQYEGITDKERVVEEIAGQWEGTVGAGECCCRTAAAAVSAGHRAV